MKASTIELVTRAKNEGFAIPAFNVVDETSMKAILCAAEKKEAPVIIQVSVKTLKHWGTASVTTMFETLNSQTISPAVLHLDHCPDRKVIDEVIAAGWDSVLFDASDRDFEQAVDETRQVADIAHRDGVAVESEIENIVGVEDGIGVDEVKRAYSVSRLIDAAAHCGADLIAPQLGTAHGRYSSSPVLLTERAAQIRDLTEIPIVLHGGTGLTEEQFHQFIRAGVAKINISTEVKRTYMQSALSSLEKSQHEDVWEPLTLFEDVSQSLVQAAAKFFDIFGASGKAAKTS